MYTYIGVYILHVYIYICSYTHSYVWLIRDLKPVLLLRHACGIRHSYVVTRLSDVCNLICCMLWNIYTYLHIYICMYVDVYVCVCTYVYVNIYIHIYTHIYLKPVPQPRSRTAHSLAGSCPFTCVTWLIHVCDMTHPCALHDSSICVPRFKMSLSLAAHSYMWHDAFICATWLIHMCYTTHLYVCHDRERPRH